MDLFFVRSYSKFVDEITRSRVIITHAGAGNILDGRNVTSGYSIAPAEPLVDDKQNCSIYHDVRPSLEKETHCGP